MAKDEPKEEKRKYYVVPAGRDVPIVDLFSKQPLFVQMETVDKDKGRTVLNVPLTLRRACTDALLNHPDSQKLKARDKEWRFAVASNIVAGLAFPRSEDEARLLCGCLSLNFSIEIGQQACHLILFGAPVPELIGQMGESEQTDETTTTTGATTTTEVEPEPVVEESSATQEPTQTTELAKPAVDPQPSRTFRLGDI